MLFQDHLTLSPVDWAFINLAHGFGGTLGHQFGWDRHNDGNWAVSNKPKSTLIVIYCYFHENFWSIKLHCSAHVVEPCIMCFLSPIILQLYLCVASYAKRMMVLSFPARAFYYGRTKFPKFGENVVFSNTKSILSNFSVPLDITLWISFGECRPLQYHFLCLHCRVHQGCWG